VGFESTIAVFEQTKPVNAFDHVAIALDKKQIDVDSMNGDWNWSYP
jgi:hypothetical protein